MTRRLTKTFQTLLAAIALVGACAASAQEFPIKGKPIRVIVAFPPGIGVDAQARGDAQAGRVAGCTGGD